VFTGIVKELGVVRRIDAAGDICKLEISCRGVSENASVGGSVAVNGVCLTVTRKTESVLCFDVMAETVRRTALSGLHSGDAVNLEESLTPSGALDGHFVLGHVDCVGTVKEVRSKGGEFIMRIAFPGAFGDLLVDKGSVAVDGVSLTVGEAGKDAFSVYLIPHTLKATALGSRKPGSSVNIEFDIIGKYIARILDAQIGKR
jgi:riboflavin synthase